MRKFSGLAIAALQHHPGVARATTGQKFVVTDTIVDRDGSTHVRIDAHHGLRVVGGDLVVHPPPAAAGTASARRWPRR